MQLMTNELAERIPELYRQNSKGDDAIVYAKLFLPNSWEWYITEYDNEDMCFGLIFGLDMKLGYFSIKELEGFNINIKRDENFKVTTVREIKKINTRY